MSRTHVVSPTELRLRRLLKDKPRMGPLTISTLLKLDEWTNSLQSGEGEAPLRRKLTATASDPIQQIAENLIERSSGIERQLLSKSLQEALFYAVKFETELNATQIKMRLKRFLDHEKSSAFIQQFLRLLVFNYVWFHIGESVRAAASSSQVFEKEMEEVEKICERAVASVLKSYQQIEHPLDRNTAKELIQSIEQRIRGT
jgi:hypothetical protein